MSILYIVILYFFSNVLTYSHKNLTKLNRRAGRHKSPSEIFKLCKDVLMEYNCLCKCNGILLTRRGIQDDIAYGNASHFYPEMSIEECLASLREGACSCGCMGETSTIDPDLLQKPPGYFSESYEETLIAITKNKGITSQGMHRAYKEIIKKGELVWLGIPLASYLFTKTFMINNEDDPEAATEEATRLLTIYQRRDLDLEPYELQLFVQADDLIRPDEGEPLLMAAHNMKSGGGYEKWISLYKRFLKPFEIALPSTVKDLCDNVNKALTIRQA